LVRRRPIIGCAAGVAANLPSLTVVWRGAWPYALYAGAWLASYLLHPSPAGAHEGLNQLFLATVACVAQLRQPRRLLAVLIALFAVSGLMVFGPVSVVMGSGRATHYKSLDQRAGYPEVGLPMALGASACLGLLFATPRRALPLAAASGVLGAGLATWYIMSRSAILTVAAATAWLAVAAAIRFRTRLAMIALLIILASGVLIVSKIGVTGWRLTATPSGGTMELDIRQEGWRVATLMMRNSPWLGVGPGRYSESYARYSSGATAHTPTTWCSTQARSSDSPS
jgi:hypothetical protein